MIFPNYFTKKRSKDHIREHYEIEKVLATKLKNASKPERRVLYSAVYDELFARVPDHPQVLERDNPDVERRNVLGQMRWLEPMLGPDMTFLEIGAGGGALSRRVANRVRQVYAVDVTFALRSRAAPEGNLKFVLSDGVSIPVPPKTIDLAFSDQLLEHLHPDDSVEHFHNVYKVLKPGGHYFCSTPNRLRGPCDVSRYFDTIATGFHLKEYTYGEVETMFRDIGFRRLRAVVGIPRWHFRCRVGLVRSVENAIGTCPVASIIGWRASATC